MNLTVLPGRIAGSVKIIPSKSQLHRLLICAALSDQETILRCEYTDAEDVNATIDCLTALGAVIRWEEAGLLVQPLQREKLPSTCIFPCGESGSTLRFLLPIVCALGIEGEFQLSGRLPERPLSPLDAELSRNGCRLKRPEPDILRCEGRLMSGDYQLPGNVSSQYVTGLLLALPLLEGDSSLTITPPIESEAYIDMTLETLEAFGAIPSQVGNHYQIRGKQIFSSPGTFQVEGDWSNAAFWLCAGAMQGGAIKCGSLNSESLQGDRAVWRVLAEMGATVSWKEDVLSVLEGSRRAVTIDASGIPDLIPALAVVAAVSEGVTIVRNASRLRLKESDRLSAIAKTLNSLGANVLEEADGLKIQGVPCLKGGTVDAWGDHRIAMMAAVASTACQETVTIIGAEAVKKSYPSFWIELSSLGKCVVEEDGI